jgi:hypothetical protein
MTTILFTTFFIILVFLALIIEKHNDSKQSDFSNIERKLEIILTEISTCVTFEQLETGYKWAYEVIDPTIKTETWVSLKHKIDEAYNKTKNNIIFKSTNNEK